MKGVLYCAETSDAVMLAGREFIVPEIILTLDLLKDEPSVVVI